MGSVPERIPATYTDRILGYMEMEKAIGYPMIQLELKFTEPLDIQRLQKSVYLSFDAEPILGSRLVPHWYRPFFQRINSDSIKYFYTTESIEEFDSFRGMLIDIYQGPQLEVYHYHFNSDHRLLFKVSHNITDGGGLNKIARTISSIYSRLKDDPQYKPIPNINASRGLNLVTKHLKWHAYIRIYLNNLKHMRSFAPRHGTHGLRFEESPLIPLGFVHNLIAEERVAHLKEYGHSHNATLNELMITAIFRALIIDEEWDQRSHLRLRTTVDWRRWYMRGEEGEVIANLSAYEWPSLGDNIGKDFPTTLEYVVSFFKKRKSCYLGLNDLTTLFMLGLLPDKLSRKMFKKWGERLVNKNNWPHGFTNMGEIRMDAVNFDHPPDSAWLIPPPYYPPNFTFGLSGYKGTLTLSSSVCPSHRDRVTQFFKNVVSQLPV